MAERDAFGREIGEDTLAQMGWRGGRPGAPPDAATREAPAAGEARAREAPAVAWTPPPPETTFAADPALARPGWQAPAPVAATPRAPARARRRGSRRGSMARMIFLLALLVVVGASASSLLRAGKEVVSGGSGSLFEEGPTPEAVGPADSLLRPAALKAVLAKLPEGRLTMFTVRPDGLDAQVRAGGRTTIV